MRIPASTPHKASVSSDDLTLDELRDALLGAVPTEELHALGCSFQTQDILDAQDGFVRSARDIWAHLTPAQREHFLGFDPMVLDLIAPEAEALREKKSVADAALSAGSVNADVAEAAEKALRGNALALRDQTARVLRRVHAGDDASLARIDATVGVADTNEELARGLDAMAERTTDAHAQATGARRQMLQRLGVTPAHAAKLTTAARKLRDAARVAATAGVDPRVAQRALDIHDGRVLWLVRFVHEAFRAARAFDATILLPDLGALQRLHDTGRSAKRAPAQPTPPQPVPPR